MSEVASVQTFVTDVDDRELQSSFSKGEDLIQSLCEQRSDSFLVKNLSSELEGSASEELVLVDGRMLNISDYDSNNVLLGVDSALLTGIGVGDSIELNEKSLHVIGLIWRGLSDKCYNADGC